MINEEEKKVLALLAKKWNPSEPPEIIDLFDLTAALPMAPAQALITVRGLYAEGLVGLNDYKTGAFLTPKGYAIAQALKKEDLSPE